MKVDGPVETVTVLFNDLIGAWVPGLVLSLGLLVMHVGPEAGRALTGFGNGFSVALTVAGLLFALGHLLAAVSESAVRPLFKYFKVLRWLGGALGEEMESYKIFKGMVGRNMAGVSDSLQFSDLRSIALSVSGGGAELGRRFTFLQLLCEGVGTALLVICADFLVCFLFFPNLLYGYKSAAPWFLQVILLCGAAFFLFKRADGFHYRAMNVPFLVACAEFEFKRVPGEK